MKIITIAHNAHTAKLINADREAKLHAQDALSYAVDGSPGALASFTGSGWNGRANFLEFNDGVFPRGFVNRVQTRLIARGYKVKIVRAPLPILLGPALPIVDEFPTEERYDFQIHTMDKLVRHGQIIAQVATGGGKSRIAKLCTARIGRPTLFLTTRGVLMYQMARQFKAMGKKVAILGDGNLQISKEVTCGMVQTIASWLKEPDPTASVEAQLKQTSRREAIIAALNTFEFVILEEAHEASGNGFFEIMAYCENAHYRLALTATPFMKDSEEANMRLMAVSGPIAITVSEKTLIDRGILARPYFKFITLKEKPDKLFRSTPWQRAYKLGITDNDARNKRIIVEAMRAVRYGLTVMILVQHKDHGKCLKTIGDRAGLRIEYIYGEDDQASRDAALNKLRNGELDVLIGSKIMDVGVDVPAIGMVIPAGGGKAEVELRQRIGRGLREKKSGLPNVAFIIDFADGFNTHLSSHAKQRRAIIEGTPGFAENIVDDFDFAGCGLVKKLPDKKVIN